MKQELKFQFAKGHQVKYDLYSNASSQSKLMIILPAMGVRATYYKRLARCFVEELQTDVITLDYRGMGNSSIRANRKNKIGYQAMVDDLQEVIQFHMHENNYDQILLSGHSLGGQVACMYAAAYPSLIDHVVLIGSCLPYYIGWPGSRKNWLRIAGTVFYPLSRLIGHFPGGLFGFAGREGIFTMKDWCRLVNKGEFNPHNSSTDYEKAINNFNGRITAFSFSEDEMAPKEAIDNLLDKFKSVSEKKHYTVEGYDHFNWSKSPFHIVKFLG